MPEIQVDISKVGRAVLREQILKSVRDSGYAVKPRAFWSRFRSVNGVGLPQGMLVVCDLARIAAEFRRSSLHHWIASVRRARPLFIALVRTQRDVRSTALVDDLVRYSDSRVRVCSAIPGRPGFRICLSEALAAMDPESLVDVRYLGIQDQLLVEFGDGLSGLIGWGHIGAAHLVPTLVPESATVGPGGRAVELLTKQGDLFEIDSGSIRAALDSQFAGSLRDQASHSNTSVGGRLRGHRESAGLTQIDLSERTGIDQAVISRLERGKHGPRLDTLQRAKDGRY